MAAVPAIAARVLPDLLKNKSSVFDCDPRDFAALKSDNSRIRSVLHFYVPKPKSELFEIWARQKAIAAAATTNQPDAIAEDERVEDAGLDQDLEPIQAAEQPQSIVRKRRVVA